MGTTILTLAIEPSWQQHFEALRREHFPPELNRVPAHVTLFHALPLDDATRDALRSGAVAHPAFPLRVAEVISLGRGVAYRLESPALLGLRRQLAQHFDASLIPQDRQGYRPHIVVQNKVSGEEARALRASLTAGFAPWTVEAEGLLWWEYLGGPWRLLERFAFAPQPIATVPADATVPG